MDAFEINQTEDDIFDFSYNEPQYNPDQLEEKKESILSKTSNEDEFIGLTSENYKKIQPAKWDSLCSIISFLSKDSDEPIVIENSTILHSLKNGAVIRVNLQDTFGSQDITLHVPNPKKWGKLFKSFKNDVYIFEEENRFIVTNGQIRLFLPKQLTSAVSKLSFPDFNQTKTITSFTLQSEARNQISWLCGGSNYIELLIQDSQMKAINIPNTALYILPEFVKDKSAQDITVDNAELVLRSSSFLPYPSDMYQIHIGFNNLTEKHFCLSSCRSQTMNIEIYEVLNDATSLNELF